MEDDQFTIELPWPAPADDSDEDEEDAEDQQRLPHELDELLGEFVDVLYGAGNASPERTEDELPDAPIPPETTSIDFSTADFSAASGSLPPSSPASLSAESVTLGWASESPPHYSASSSPTVGSDRGPSDTVHATFKRHLQQRSGAQQTAHQQAAPAPADGSDIGPTTCWGALTKGHTKGCEHGFVIGKAHFKNKFCSHCRERIDMPRSKIRAMTQELRDAYTNPLSEGFWKRAPPTLGGGAFRLVNNTQSCIGPCLIIYQTGVPELPPGMDFAPMPNGWEHEGAVPLCVAKGTLVPVLQMWKSQEEEAKNRPKRRRQEKASANGKDVVGAFLDGTGEGDGAGGSFVSQLVGMHRQLTTLLETRLEDSERTDGASMGEHQTAIVREQLAYSRAFLATAATDEVATWRSLGGLPPLISAAYSSPAMSPAVATSKWEPNHKGGVAAIAPTGGASSVLLTSCDTDALSSQAGASRPLLNPSDEAAAAAGALRGHVECTHADGVGASELEGLMAGQGVWFFCGHADASLNGKRTLAFAHARGFEMVDADTLVSMVGRHAATLKLIVLNGCKSLHLALRLVDVGVPAVACWESLLNDEAAFWFGLGFSRALAAGKPPRAAFAAAVSALLFVTEPGTADGGQGGWVQKFELADPEACGADLRTGRLPISRTGAAEERRGRIAAGVPWLICPLLAEQLRNVPQLPASYLPRREIEKQVLGALVDATSSATRQLTSSSDANTAPILNLTPRASAPPLTPRANGARGVALLGGVGRGKRLIAAWAARDYRVQSLFRDGIAWLTLSTPPPLPLSHSSSPASPSRRGAVAQLMTWLSAPELPPTHTSLKSAHTNDRRSEAVGLLRAALGRRRCLIVLDGVESLDGDAGLILDACAPEQVVLITTRSTAVASAIGSTGSSASTVSVPPLDEGKSLDLLGSLLRPPRSRDELKRGDDLKALLAVCSGEPLLIRMASALASAPASTDASVVGAAAAAAAITGGIGGMSLFAASQLLMSTPPAAWPPLRGSPRYPHGSLNDAYAAVAASLSPSARLRWEQLAIVASSSYAVYLPDGGSEVQLINGSRAAEQPHSGGVYMQHLQPWWRGETLSALSELLDRGLVLASLPPPTRAASAAGNLGGGGSGSVQDEKLLLSLPPLAARFLESYPSEAYPTPRSRARCLAEFVNCRNGRNGRSSRYVRYMAVTSGMLRALLRRRGGPRGSLKSGAGVRSAPSLIVTPVASVTSMTPRYEPTIVSNGGGSGGDVGAFKGNVVDGALAAAAAAAATSAAASVAPFRVSAPNGERVGWRSLGMHESIKDAGGEGDGEGAEDPDGTDSTTSTADERDDDMTDATDTEEDSKGMARPPALRLASSDVGKENEG